MSVVVQRCARLGGLREVGILEQTLGGALLLQLDAGVDLVETLLDLWWHGSGGRNVGAGGAETVLVGGVLDVDGLSFGRDVRVFAVLDEHAAGVFCGDVLQEARFGGINVVARFVRGLVAAVLALLLVVLENGDPSGSLEFILELVVVLGDGAGHQACRKDNL